MLWRVRREGEPWGGWPTPFFPASEWFLQGGVNGYLFFFVCVCCWGGRVDLVFPFFRGSQCPF